jgi:3-oxoacyl-[acyl-carrier protein] reductase
MGSSDSQAPLLNKIALVTGATGGIGSAVCRRLAAQGCSIGLHYNTDKDAAAALKEELTKSYGNKFGSQFECCAADMGDYDQVRCSSRKMNMAERAICLRKLTYTRSGSFTST